MSYKCVIIPSKSNYEDIADDVCDMLRREIKHTIIIEIDKNYNELLKSRIETWIYSINDDVYNDDDYNYYDIIIIDEDYVESNHIKVKFNDMLIKTMTLTDFIDYTNDDDNNANDDDDNNVNVNANDDDDNDYNCIIM